jgi:hypothetical protein
VPPTGDPPETLNRKILMRDTKANDWFVRNSSDVPLRMLRLAGLALAIGFVVTSGVARAQEETDEDKTFEEKIMDGVMAGIGGTNMDNRGIDCRERSPLVVPPKLDLPPPASAAATSRTPPNWPKDPDIARRKAEIARKKKENKDPLEAARVLTPSEMNVGKTAATPATPGEVNQPGVGDPGRNAILNPSELGFDSSKLNVFKSTNLFGGNKAEVAPFKGEPTRDSLTQPPAGYQTPSPNFAYGTGPKESLNKEYNPAQGKYGE